MKIKISFFFITHWKCWIKCLNKRDLPPRRKLKYLKFSNGLFPSLSNGHHYFLLFSDIIWSSWEFINFSLWELNFFLWGKLYFLFIKISLSLVFDMWYLFLIFQQSLHATLSLYGHFLWTIIFFFLNHHINIFI